MTGLQKVSIDLLGDASTQMLNIAIKGYAYELGYNFEICEADFDQIDLQIFNSHSDLYDHPSDFVIIAETQQKLLKKFYDQSLEERPYFADKQLNRIKDIFNQLDSLKSPKAIIYFNFQEEDDGMFGNFANKTEFSFLYQVRKLNFLLTQFAVEHTAFQIMDYKLIHQRIGDEKAFSPQSYINNSMTLSLDVLPYASKYCVDIIAAQLGVFKKCLILDLDNTMWGGVIGDDGIENIQIGNLGIGKAFTALQKWAKELKERGIILAICSKNYEEVAKNVFENHPEMVLKLEDVSVFVANWDNKADNIKYIQNVLNIGFDSMVFLDDNKFERELVKQNIPQITVPDLPEDPAEYVNYLKHLNLFETATFVQNDTQRTKQYQEESERKKDEVKYSSQDDFLKDLQMKADVSEFNEFNLPRIAQLIQRSNQFNLRTIRYSEEELRKLKTSDNHVCFSVSLSDKYGDYGLVSILIVEIKDDSYFIDTWVMSCRVLNRGLENFVINYLENLVKEDERASKIVGEYLPTKKNILVKELYESLGFVEVNMVWELSADKFETKKTFISETDKVK